MTTAPCPHNRLQIIAQDETAQFVECLDCKEIFEKDDLKEMERTEDLSDA